MDITEYKSKNEGKYVLVLREDDIKVLNHFAGIAKNGDLKGLIVCSKYAGFTDTYRLLTVKDTHEELSGSNTATPLMYDVLDVLKKAKSLAVLEDGKVTVEAYPNDESKLFLEIMELDNTKASLKTSLNFKYVDLWFKWIKANKFNIALGKNNRSAIKFSNENTDYIVMPQALRS
jgi:hypothetical protein